MSNKEVVVEILKTYGCSTSKEIANIAHRKYEVSISPAQVAGVLRPLIARGHAASSKSDKNTTVYWLNNHSWDSETNLDSL